MRTILTDNMQDLQRMVQAAKYQSNSFGLNINISKPKFMIVSLAKTPDANVNVSINNRKMKRVSKFLYVGFI